MEIDVFDLLHSNGLLLTFVVIGCGYLIGAVRIASIAVGPTTGVLLAGLLLGHLGMPSRPEAASFGFAIFIFSVGLQAGPRFFSAFLEDGLKYIALAGVVAGTALLLASLLTRWLDLETGFGAGLLAGALTSTPTLAGAQDAIDSGLAHLPEGLSAAEAATNVSVGYALTYIFGTVGLIVFVRFFPGLFKIDLRAQAKLAERERGIGQRQRGPGTASTLPIIRAYRIGEAGAGQTVGQRLAALGKQLTPLRIYQGGEYLEPDSEVELREGDAVSLIGSLEEHAELIELGHEVLDPRLLDFQIVEREVVVIHADMIGKPLRKLGLAGDYGCFATGLTRAGIELPVEASSVLNKGDRLRVVGEEGHVRDLAGRLGHVEQEVEETDLLTFALGIAAGVMLGLVVFKVQNISIGLGTAGGLLLVGILIGFLSSLHPTFGRVPAPARMLLMDLGLMLFMAEVGLEAGQGIASALGSIGPWVMAAGVAVTLGPVLIGYAFGRRVLGLNPALLLGSIAGGMTSTASLNVVSEAASSPVPALGYAGTYTFANVLLTFAGTLMMMM